MTEGNQGADWSDATRVFDEHRGLLISVAYRILGSVTDAEDVVQEAWLRWVNARTSELRLAANPTSAPGCRSPC